MVVEGFTVEAAWQLGPPIYVRKVDRPGHLAPEGSSDREKIKSIQEKVFALQDGKFSVYRIETDLDLIRVAVAMNAERASKHQDLYLLALKEEDFEGIQIDQTPGNVCCTWAKKRHYDVHVTSTASLNPLLTHVHSRQRKHAKFSQSKMKRAFEFAAAQGCHAATSNPGVCECEVVASDPSGREEGAQR